MQRCNFEHNSIHQSQQTGGGAIAIGSSRTTSRNTNISLLMESCRIHGNSVHSSVESANGGGIIVSCGRSTDIQLVDCDVSENVIYRASSATGGGIALQIDVPDYLLRATISNSDIRDNRIQATQYSTGGGLSILIGTSTEGDSNITISNSTITGNQIIIHEDEVSERIDPEAQVHRGAGIYLSGINEVRMLGCSVVDNKIIPSQTTSRDIHTGDGGGLAVFNSIIVEISGENVGSVWRGNMAHVDGGAIWAMAVYQLIVRDVVIFTRNQVKSSASHGGALFVDKVKKMQLSGARFIRNCATGFGGAIAVSSVEEEGSLHACHFVDNESISGGGALFTFGHNKIKIDGCRFMDNVVTGINAHGGALLLTVSELQISTFSISKTHTFHQQGKSIRQVPLTYLVKQSKGSEIVDSEFFGNDARGGEGGAIHSVEKDVWVEINRCRFVGNTALKEGGTLMMTSNFASFQNLQLAHGISREGNGGCMSLGGEVAVLRNITMENCIALRGGGGALQIANQGTIVSSTVVSDIIVRNSTAGNGDGGGILCTEGAYCTFRGRSNMDILLRVEDNRAQGTGTGGGIACTNGAQCSITLSAASNLIVHGNSAMHGGGISVRNAKMDILAHGALNNSGGIVSIRENSAESDGGAIYIHETGIVSIESSFSLRVTRSMDVRRDFAKGASKIFIGENQAAFGGALMLYTIRDVPDLLGDSSATGSAWKGSVDIDVSSCHIRDNNATRAGGAFFVVSPPSTQSAEGALLLPESWRRGSSTMLYGNTVSSDGYGSIVATNPTTVRAEWWKVEITDMDKVLRAIESSDSQQLMPTAAGSKIWINVTIYDAFGNVVRSYPRRSPGTSQAETRVLHHPPIEIHVEPQNLDNQVTLQFDEYGSDQDGKSGSCDGDGGALSLLPTRSGIGRFAVCDGDSVPLWFSVLTSGPVVGNAVSAEKPKDATYHRARLTMVANVNGQEHVPFATSSSALDMELTPCSGELGMTAYVFLSNNTKFWTCRSSSCSWFPDSEQFGNSSLGLWITLSVISFAMVAASTISMFSIFVRRLRGSLRSWFIRIGINTGMVLKALAIIAMSTIAIIAYAFNSIDTLFSTAEKHSRLRWVFSDGKHGQYTNAILSEVCLGIVLVARLFMSLWFSILLLELSSTSFPFLGHSLFVPMVKERQSWKKRTQSSNHALRTVLHSAFAVFVVVVTAVMFTIGGLMHHYDQHNGWLVSVVEILTSVVCIIPLSLYLFELLYDRHSLWMQRALLQDMTQRSMWLYRLKHAASVVVCWLTMTVLESLALSIVFTGAPSAQLCRPFLMPLLLVPVQLVQVIVIPLILNTMPTMPTKSVGSMGGTNTSNLSDYLLMDDGELADVVLADILSPGMIIAPEDLEYGEQLGAGAQGAVFRGRLLSSGGATVAIKSIRKTDMSMSASAELRGFYRELLTLYEHGNHPNIVRLMGISEDDRKVSLILELCEGGSLSDLLRRNAESRASGDRPIVSFVKKLHILLDIALGMCHLHIRGLIHRDLKPENVLLSDKESIGMAKVADLGVAKANMQSSTSNLTMNVGTAAYVAPEVLKGSALATSSTGVNLYDERCDVYSFGILMYSVLGDFVQPYGQRMSDIDIVSRMARDPASFRPPHDETEVPFIAECIENSHRWYVDLMRQCWHVDPTQRPPFTEVARRIRSHVS